MKILKLSSWAILFCLLLFAISCKNNEKGKNEKNSLITGKLTNFRNNQIILKSINKTDTLAVNEDGSFEITINISSPTYFDFFNDKNNLLLYIFPKEKLTITADCSNFNESLKFEGKSQHVNKYLNDYVLNIKNAGINSENFLYSSNIDTFKNSLNEFIDKLNTNLNNFKSEYGKELKDFCQLEQNRINILKVNLMISYYNPILRTDKKNEEFEKEIEKAYNSIDMNNPELLKISELKNFFSNLINYNMNIELRNSNKELKKAEEYTKLFFETLDKFCVEPEVKEEMYYTFITEFLRYYGPESVYENYENYKNFTTNRARLSELDKIFAEYAKTLPGNESVNWSFPDKNGEKYSLSDFKGKYVYIDVWASWCAPCLRELPYLKALHTKYKNKNLEIISISVDENRNDWLNKIESEGLTNIQLYAGGWNNELCNFFKINGIPRFILIDKEGKIISANAERPSGNLEEVLNSLEGI